jgi:hypothetical protein
MIDPSVLGIKGCLATARQHARCEAAFFSICAGNWSAEMLCGTPAKASQYSSKGLKIRKHYNYY